MNKYGEVVRIRIDPADVMSCIDLCKAGGVITKDLSLAQVVKLALSGMLENARRQNIVPTRTGYEYAEMVQPFKDTGRNNAKLQLTDAIEKSKLKLRMPEPATPIIEDSPSIKRQKAKLLTTIMELEQKKQVDPDNFSDAEFATLENARMEYDKLL